MYLEWKKYFKGECFKMVLISMSLISLVRRFGQLFKALHTQGVCKKA